MIPLRAIAASLLLALAACESAPTRSDTSPGADGARPGFEAISLFGEELPRPAIPEERRGSLASDLLAARLVLERQPNDPDAHVWVGRRLGYLGRYREAVDAFTAGLRRSPQSYRLLRHRGHRNITLRRLDAAVDDLSRAAALSRGVPDEVEPDGAPNRWNIPRSTDQSNIYYHLALAHYLRGEFRAAELAFTECLDYAAVNDDMLVATLYWLSNSAARARGPEASLEQARRAHPEMHVLENHAYHRLLLARAAGTSEELLVETAPGSLDWLTTAYGVSVSREIAGDHDGARALREEILASSNWAAFGFIAAEADLARAQGTPR